MFDRTGVNDKKWQFLIFVAILRSLYRMFIRETVKDETNETTLFSVSYAPRGREDHRDWPDTNQELHPLIRRIAPPFAHTTLVQL